MWWKRAGLYCVVLVTIVIVVGGGPARALKVMGIRISGDADFLRTSASEGAILQCEYQLADGDVIQQITWYHDDLPALTWSPPDSAAAGEGLGKEDVVLTRADDHLEFVSVQLRMAGKYRCSVTTTEGFSMSSPQYQLLVVDMPSDDSQVTSSVKDCIIHFSWAAPAINPKPKPRCGIWLNGQYASMATAWQATPYYNGSIAYRLEEEKFPILHMPVESVIRCELGITKIDQTRVVLLESISNFTEVWERGCPALEVGDGIALVYDNMRLTCHGEMKSIDDAAPLVARVQCKEGYHAQYAHLVQSVELVCRVTKWEVGGGKTWNHFDNLVCVEESETQEVMRKSSITEAELSEGSREQMNGESRLGSPWLLFTVVIFASFTFLAACSYKNIFVKSDAKFKLP